MPVNTVKASSRRPQELGDERLRNVRAGELGGARRSRVQRRPAAGNEISEGPSEAAAPAGRAR